MSSHVCRSYLTSCLKVPIGTCNNCPTPDYNRSKLYLGRLSATPTATNKLVMPKLCSETGKEPKWSNGCIKSLAKLYDSIPDYRDLNHLSEEEFYSTLNALKSTCHELKTNFLSSEDRCSTTSSILTSKRQLKGSRSKTNKKSRKKKKSTENFKKCYESPQIKITPEENGNYSKISGTISGIRAPNISLTKECSAKDKFTSKQQLNEEVENFKKSLQKFEARPSTTLNSNESRSFIRCSPKESVKHIKNDNRKQNENVPVRNTFTSKLRENLRKSFSFHDLRSITISPELSELRKKNKTLDLLSFKGESDALKNSTKLSDCFLENLKSAGEGIPEITIDSPSTKQSCTRANRLPEKTNSKQKRTKSEEYKIPFKLFDAGMSTKEKSIKHLTPSPIHPVARPNLAATLRTENSKKKVRELKNNCTFLDTTPQFDWEVRKTPAWKTLSLNETHQQILQLRLATRKAEQALQQREYELNMELMRQRVKSAPLLLEGRSYWGSHAGKRAHACQKEDRRHTCQSTLQRARSKKNSSLSNCCRRKMLFSTSSSVEEDNSDNTTNTFRVPIESSTGKSEKLNEQRNIYGSNRKGTKTQSRNSNHSANTPQYPQYHEKKNPNNEIEKKSYKDGSIVSNIECAEIDSGDELSSLDRAFL